MNGPQRGAETGVVLSVRETRMIVERILLTTGLPDGFVPAAGNCVLYSQALGLGGLAAFETAIAALTGTKLSALRVVEDKDAVAIDGGGLHAWLIANDALELALARHRAGAVGQAEIRNVLSPDELLVMEGLAYRHDARADVVLVPGGATVRIVADRTGEPDVVMDAALRDGFAVSRRLWRSLFDRSGDALTPDSIESRRHAGPVMVDAEGRVHGRDDDDTDFELLMGGQGSGPKASENA